MTNKDDGMRCVQGMVATVRPKMSAYLAVGILDGFEDAIDRDQVIEAARWIRDNGPRGVLSGSGTQRAIALADAADAGTLDNE